MTATEGFLAQVMEADRVAALPDDPVERAAYLTRADRLAVLAAGLREARLRVTRDVPQEGTERL
jgi:hypothetical protein